VSGEVGAVEKERGVRLSYALVGCALHKRFNRVSSGPNF
jgi:hypothetical protein